jgi:hypothetical protein
VPFVKPDRLTTSVPPEPVASAQAILVPLHAPERTSTTASKLAEPVTVTVWYELEVAVNLYQTSSFAVPVTPPHEIAAIDCVAPATVPFVVVQVELTVKLVALGQLSLAGAEPLPQLEHRHTIVVKLLFETQLYCAINTRTVVVEVAVHCIFGLLLSQISSL